MCDSEWQRVIKRMNTNESKYNRVTLCFKRNKRPIRFLNNFIQFSMQYITTIRTSRTQMFFETMLLKFAIFTGKHLRWSLFLVKLQVWRHVTLLKRDSNTCFSVNIANFLRKFQLKYTNGGCFCTCNSPRIWLYKSGNWWHIFSIKYFVYIMYFFTFIAISFAEVIKTHYTNYFLEL